MSVITARVALRRSLLIIAILFSLTVAEAPARVVRIEVVTRGDFKNGRAHSFEKLTGRIHFEIDPRLRQNRIIRDLDLAPKNTAGNVEFSADFELIKPKDLRSGNGALLFEVANRGHQLMLAPLDQPPSGAPPQALEADPGEGLLMREGYSALWVGWQFDVDADADGLLGFEAPIAAGDDQPVEGLVRSEIRVKEKIRVQGLGDRGHRGYAVSNKDDPQNVLTVRDTPTGERQVIPRAHWRFAREEDGRVHPDPAHVYLESGFEPGRIYEIIYVSRNPAVAGTGLAAIRDAISRLKHEGAVELSIPTGLLRRSIAIGASQSGRLLRTFLYDGFNEDENGRRVFDGVIPLIAGGKRGSFNHRFAQPSRGSASFFYPPDIFPSLDASQTHPATGKTDGLLAGIPPPIMPKVFHIHSSTEYWRSSAALTHTTVDGRSDTTPLENVRIYHFSGTRHNPFPRFPPRGSPQGFRDNPNASVWFLRALLLAMDRWIDDGTPPPPSQFPSIDGGSLVELSALDFPRVGSLRAPIRVRREYVLNHGPDFLERGIISKEPPDVGRAYPFLVPAVDESGNEVGGLRSPSISVPLGTYTGWSPGEPESNRGIFIPFARTEAQRLAAGDPRPSIAERYTGLDEYLDLVAREARVLVEGGYLLGEDIAAVRRHAVRMWNLVMVD